MHHIYGWAFRLFLCFFISFIHSFMLLTVQIVLHWIVLCIYVLSFLANVSLEQISRSGIAATKRKCTCNFVTFSCIRIVPFCIPALYEISHFPTVSWGKYVAKRLDFCQSNKTEEFYFAFILSGVRLNIFLHV